MLRRKPNEDFGNKKIIILDIDKTIDQNCQTNQLIQLLDTASYNEWYVYVITARRLFPYYKGDIHELLKYCVNPVVYGKLYNINFGKDIKEWVFYNESRESPIDVLMKNKNKKLKNAIKNIGENFFTRLKNKVIPSIKDNDLRSYALDTANVDFWSFCVGINKMLQIEQIIKKLKETYKEIPLSSVYFFDDSSVNVDAWRFYSNINTNFKYLHFYGGANRCVFYQNNNPTEGVDLCKNKNDRFLVGGDVYCDNKYFYRMYKNYTTPIYNWYYWYNSGD
jgi:hypothetical protein